MKSNGGRLDVLRDSQTEEQSPGGDFVKWLLDMRQGKSPGKPPVESLRKAFKRGDFRLLCMSLRRLRGEVASEHLALLRDPRLMFATYEKNRTTIYMDVLDALELEMANKR
jgi:hypothetical protein